MHGVLLLSTPSPLPLVDGVRVTMTSKVGEKESSGLEWSLGLAGLVMLKRLVQSLFVGHRGEDTREEGQRNDGVWKNSLVKQKS